MNLIPQEGSGSSGISLLGEVTRNLRLKLLHLKESKSEHSCAHSVIKERTVPRFTREDDYSFPIDSYMELLQKHEKLQDSRQTEIKLLETKIKEGLNIIEAKQAEIENKQLAVRNFEKIVTTLTKQINELEEEHSCSKTREKKLQEELGKKTIIKRNLHRKFTLKAMVTIHFNKSLELLGHKNKTMLQQLEEKNEYLLRAESEISEWKGQAQALEVKLNEANKDKENLLLMTNEMKLDYEKVNMENIDVLIQKYDLEKEVKALKVKALENTGLVDDCRIKSRAYVQKLLELKFNFENKIDHFKYYLGRPRSKSFNIIQDQQSINQGLLKQNENLLKELQILQDGFQRNCSCPKNPPSPISSETEVFDIMDRQFQIDIAEKTKELCRVVATLQRERQTLLAEKLALQEKITQLEAVDSISARVKEKRSCERLPQAYIEIPKGKQGFENMESQKGRRSCDEIPPQMEMRSCDKNDLHKGKKSFEKLENPLKGKKSCDKLDLKKGKKSTEKLSLIDTDARYGIYPLEKYEIVPQGKRSCSRFKTEEVLHDKGNVIEINHTDLSKDTSEEKKPTKRSRKLSETFKGVNLTSGIKICVSCSLILKRSDRIIECSICSSLSHSKCIPKDHIDGCNACNRSLKRKSHLS